MNKKRRIAIVTLGCKVNQYESQAIQNLFEANGDHIVSADQAADIFIINTCTVTHTSDKKSRQLIRRAKRHNPQALIVVVGCYAQISPQQVAAIEGVNLILGTAERNQIVRYCEVLSLEDKRCIVTDSSDEKPYEALHLSQIEGKTRAFIKVQDGCNEFCSYCIIPKARGRIRSRSLDDCLTEISGLVARGYREVVLTGIHLSSYGKEMGTLSLIDLIRRVDDVIGLQRLRLGSLEPRIITAEFLKALRRVDSFCPQFHLSLQSGSDKVLKVMNRKYNTADYRQAVRLIRQHFSDAAVTTDVIVGFPGESEADFAATCRFVEEIDFADIHVFPYSPRQGTPAASMANQIKGEVKATRVKQLSRLAAQMKAHYLKRFIGRTLWVLIEETEPLNTLARGLTIYHHQVVVACQDVKQNQCIPCYIEASDDYQLYGRSL